MAVVSGDKASKYISSILEELVFSIKVPTKLLCENNVEKMMEKYKKPTYRSRKIGVYNFTLQEWVYLKKSLNTSEPT